jgi:tetratricopeptide (TPR) repeat protein
MPANPDKPTNFWQELKRRKVVRVIIGYAAAAYVLLELTSIVAEPLGLPAWTINFVLILLCVGFVITAIVSWIYDFTPKGIEKTKPVEDSKEQEKVIKPSKRKLKPSDVIISVLFVVVIILLYPRLFNRDTLEKLTTSGERISVAVMPFQNRTRDALWEDSEEIIQDIIKNSLSNSEELEVRATESIDLLMQSQGLTNNSALTPSLARKISKKLDVKIFIYGSINQAGNEILLQAELADSKTGAIIKSFQIEGKAEEDNSIVIGKSLSGEINNFLIISELEKDKSTSFEISTSINSPEAYRYYSLGKEAFFKWDLDAARNSLLQAVSIDPDFNYAAFLLAFTYSHLNNIPEAKKWALWLYEKRDQMLLLEKTDVNRLHAIFFETGYEVLKYTKQLLEFDDQNPRFWYNLANAYRAIYQFDNAIPAYEKSLEIYDKWKSKPLWNLSYTQLGECYHATRQYKKEKKLYKKAEKDFPGDLELRYRQAILAFSEGKTEAANEYIGKFITILNGFSVSEAEHASRLATIYTETGYLDNAEEYYRKALSLEPENQNRRNTYAFFLIDHDRNVKEGLQLVESTLESQPENYNFLYTKGWGLHQLGKNREALEILQKSWDLRMKNSIYDHTAFLRLEEARKAVNNQQSN